MIIVEIVVFVLWICFTLAVIIDDAKDFEWRARRMIGSSWFILTCLVIFYAVLFKWKT
jgi:hypothetical protein